MQSFKKTGLTTIAVAITLLVSPAKAQRIDATNTLPNAKAGECYAKVVIPATYKTEDVKVTTREASARFEMVPAKYKWTTERVLVKEASKKLVPVPATYEASSETIEVSPAGNVWVSGKSAKASPASPALLSAVRSMGVKLNDMAVGTCLHEHYNPAQFKDEAQQVLKTAGYEKFEIEPAVFEWVEEQVLVKEGTKKVVEVPAQYNTVTEKVLISPATTVWKKGRGLVERLDNSTGEIMCLVEVPAKYETVSRKIIKSVASTREVDIPAEYTTQRVRKMVRPAQKRSIKIEPTYETVTKRVQVADASFQWHEDGNPNHVGKATGNRICLRETPAKYATVKQRKIKTAATVNEVEVPAVYKTVKVRKLVSAPTQTRIEIPAVVKSVPKQVKVNEERLEWRSVLCETNMTKTILSDIQRALKKSGFDPGPIDGQVGGQTLRAVDSYQRAKGLERGGLTMSTLKSLGVGI